LSPEDAAAAPGARTGHWRHGTPPTDDLLTLEQPVTPSRDRHLPVTLAALGLVGCVIGLLALIAAAGAVYAMSFKSYIDGTSPAGPLGGIAAAGCLTLVAIAVLRRSRSRRAAFR